MTLRSFVSRAADFVRYQAVTYNMDSLYDNATHAELEASGDRTCIICREEMIAFDAPPPAPAGAGAEAGLGSDASAGQRAGAEAATPAPAPAPAPTPAERPAAGGPNETPKKLPCGHTFHCHCLRSWLERQQSCPTW
jgi:E3 ubiquitin-protein ligase synoviolin